MGQLYHYLSPILGREFLNVVHYVCEFALSQRQNLTENLPQKCEVISVPTLRSDFCGNGGQRIVHRTVAEIGGLTFAYRTQSKIPI